MLFETFYSNMGQTDINENEKKNLEKNSKFHNSCNNFVRDFPGEYACMNYFRVNVFCSLRDII